MCHRMLIHWSRLESVRPAPEIAHPDLEILYLESSRAETKNVILSLFPSHFAISAKTKLGSPDLECLQVNASINIRVLDNGAG
jgi:hypothetical protein